MVGEVDCPQYGVRSSGLKCYSGIMFQDGCYRPQYAAGPGLSPMVNLAHATSTQNHISHQLGGKVGTYQHHWASFSRCQQVIQLKSS